MVCEGRVGGTGYSKQQNIINPDKHNGNASEVSEYEQKTKIPMGLSLYLAENVVRAIKGEGTKDPLKILSNSLNNYSESPYYKGLKKIIKKTGEAAIWLLDKTGPLINKDITPYGMGNMENNKNIYM